MNSSEIFLVCNQFVLIGWLILLLAPKWKYTERIAIYIAVLMLSVLYSLLVLYGLNNFNLNSFSTLQNVKHVFQNDDALLAGWIHYLAFDLFVGVYILKQTQALKIPHLFNLVLLPITFLLGPLGFAIFMLVKAFYKKYSHIEK